MKNLNVKYQSFSKALKHLFVGIFLIIAPVFVQAQSRVISGFVHDDKKEPLPGVTILVKGTKTATSTDFDGKFKIAASANDQLVFSYVGFETSTLTVGSSQTLNVSLTETTSKLNEVVVVGYGTQKKANLTGAVSTVSGKAIENRPVTNLANALQGTVPGMNVTRTGGQPGRESMSIQLRGATSANGAVNPLLVVDGVPTAMFVLQSMNPNDVESISVLKDAAAASIYGAQAAGGVILVTTKKGKDGKTIFEASSNVGIQKPMYILKRLSLLDEATITNLAKTNAGQAPEYDNLAMTNLMNGAYTYFVPGNPRFLYLNTHDWTKDILKEQSIIQNYNVSARGGSDKFNYLFSTGFLDQGGFLRVGPDHFKRFNARMNVGAELNKYLYLDSKISYTNYVTDAPSGGTVPIGDIYKSIMRNPIFNQEGQVEGGSSIGLIYGNLLYGGYNQRKIDEVNATFQATIKNLVKGLVFRTIYSNQLQSDDTEDFKRTYTLPNRNLTASPVVTNIPNAYNLSQSIQKTTNFQFLTDYNLTIAEDHKFAVLGGYQWDDFRWSNLTAGVTNMQSNDLPSLNLGDPLTKTNGQSIATFANQSLFGRFNYSYKDKYLVEFTIRSDESSRLAPGKRTKTFPAFSLGWNIHKEGWFSNNISFISELKPRFSWGQLGNALGIGYYDYMSTIGTGSVVLGSPETKTTYFNQSSIASSNLSWETVETYNYGVDFGFFKNKLTGSFDYYTKENRNMLTPLVLPATFGVAAPKINNGVLESWGWELAMNFKDKIGKDFNYSIGFNLSNNDNKLKSYTGKTVVGAGVNTLIEGEPLNTIWGYRTQPGYINNAAELAAAPVYSPLTGIGDIAYVDQNGDKKVNAGAGSIADHGDLVKLGTNQQQYLFGVTGSANWKNVDFSFFIQGVGKRSFIPSMAIVAPNSGVNFYPSAIHMDYWTPENPNAAFPRPYYTGNVNTQPSSAVSDRWVLNGAYARLKNIQLGYSLPASALNKGFFTKVRFYVSGENVFTVSKLGVFKTVIDPEQNNNEYSHYPILGVTSLGVNLIF